MKFAVIPVKHLSSAKERLSTVLSPEERAHLALAMYEDVLEVVASSKVLDQVMVISNDETALSMATERGAIITKEREQLGQSVSVDLAIRTCLDLGATAVVSLPTDVPLITEADIDLIMSKACTSPFVLLAPSRDEDGTNALLRTPPDIIRSRFGPASFKHHMSEIYKKGIPYQIIRLPNLSLDIDTAEDLAVFATCGRRTKTHLRLRERGILEKLYGCQNS